MAAARKKAILSGIQDKVGDGMFEFSQHATDQAIVRGIRVQEIREAVAAGELIEDYGEDKYGPSCLVLRFTASGRPLQLSVKTGHQAHYNIRAGPIAMDRQQEEEAGS